MLQAAFGGYFLVSDGKSQFINDLVYYEPGFNIMSPLEIESSKADRVFILIRKRSGSSGDSFDALDPTDISVEAKDVTNGESLTTAVSTNITNPEWNFEPSGHTPILVEINNQIDLVNPLLRVRVIDCNVKDNTDNSFINFRITVSDDGQFFHYISVDRKTVSDRNTFSSSGREAYITLNESSDTYILFSPYAWLKEISDKNKSDFSYPLSSIYYQKQDSYNKEDFTFSLGSYTHSFIPEQISVMDIPSYSKAGIILVDNMLYTRLSEIGRSASANIIVQGELSGITDTFKVNFFR